MIDMENQIKGLTIEEISHEIGLEETLVRRYIEGPLKEDIEQEKLDLGGGKYDPYIIDLIVIQLEVDSAGQRLEKHLEVVRESKKAGSR